MPFELRLLLLAFLVAIGARALSAVAPVDAAGQAPVAPASPSVFQASLQAYCAADSPEERRAREAELGALLSLESRRVAAR